MKKINSIIRTLCLVALLCLTSGNAFAYKIYGSGDIDATSWSPAMRSDKILVVTENATVNNCNVAEGYALVILPGAKVEVTQTFSNQGTIYVFGLLLCWEGIYPSNGGTIKIIGGNFLHNKLIGQGTINENFNPFQLVPIKAPTSNETGLKEYWEAKFVCGDDVYPMYYEDESRTKQINDLDTWKANDGKLVYKSAPTKIDGQQPTAAHDFVGWKDYYQQVCTTSTGSDYNIYFEDEAFTKQIRDLEAWKTTDGMMWGAEIAEKLYILEKQNGEFVYDGNITIGDKDIYQSKYDFTVNGNLIYRRTFNNNNQGKWQCWYMPFDISVAEMREAGLETAEIAGILLDNEGNTVVAFNLMKSGEVKANTPYVVRAKFNNISINKNTGMNFRKSDEDSFSVQSAYENFTFKGNYKNAVIDDCYTLNTSGEFMKMGSGVALSPMRFWLNIEERKDGPYYKSGADAKEIIKLTVLGEDETSAIHNAQFTMHNGDNTLYNLNGQRVTSIQSGKIYIMNGKKYIAR